MQRATRRPSPEAAAAARTPTASWPADRPAVTSSPGRWSTASKATSTTSTPNPQFNNNTNTLANGNAFAIAQSLTTNFLATVRPRIGIAADRNLAYITGGAAFTSVSYTTSYVDANTPPGTGTASASRALVGWTAGAGWEYAWADHWTVRAEYLLASFPTTNALGTIAGAGGTNTLHGSTDLVIQVVRAGVNFKF